MMSGKCVARRGRTHVGVARAQKTAHGAWPASRGRSRMPEPHIEMFDTSHRRHSTLGSLSPNEVEAQARGADETHEGEKGGIRRGWGKRRSLIVGQPRQGVLPVTTGQSGRRPQMRRKA